MNQEIETQPTKFSDRIRQKIIRTRQANGLSLEKFGQLCGATKQSIHQIESGKNLPSLDLLDRIEVAFAIKF